MNFQEKFRILLEQATEFYWNWQQVQIARREEQADNGQKILLQGDKNAVNASGANEKGQ